MHKLGFRLFDFDNHYYEPADVFTRHGDRRLGARGVQWATANGRDVVLIGGRVSPYIPNPRFDPVAKPGVLHDWFRGNPDRLEVREAFGTLEAIRPEYRDRVARLRAMDDQGIGGIVLFPTLAMNVEDMLQQDPEACSSTFAAFNRWLDDDWGYKYEGRIFAAPYIPMLDPTFAYEELQRVLDLGAIVVNIRNTAVPVPGGFSSPFAPSYDRFWGLAAESGVVVGTHASIEGYDVVINMWERGQESAFFRSPLRNVIGKSRAVSDFYATAICQLLFDRFPGLRLASIENGATWIPDLLHRLADAANTSPSYFAHDPVQTFRENVWVTPFWEDSVVELLPSMPAERMLLGSDWPHAEGVAEPIDFVADSLTGADDMTVRRVARDNALELLGVSVP